jgi:16S rRNA processing protein RimM
LSAGGRLVSVGRVGSAHGRDGSFWVEGAVEAAHEALAQGAEVVLGEERTRVERRAGSSERPLLRIAGIGSRAEAVARRGEAVLVDEELAPLGPGEWLVEDLVGARVEGLGEVRRVLAGASCDLLEVGEDGLLIPLVADAVVRIDPGARVIEVDRGFLGLGEADADARGTE